MRYKDCETEEGKECMRAYGALRDVMGELERKMRSTELRMSGKKVPMLIHEAMLIAYANMWTIAKDAQEGYEDMAAEAEGGKEVRHRSYDETKKPNKWRS